MSPRSTTTKSSPGHAVRRLVGGFGLLLCLQGFGAAPLLAEESMAEASAAGDGGMTGGARDAGRAIGTTVREVGQGAKEFGLQVGHGAATAGRAIGHAAKEAGLTVGRAAAEGGREFMRAVRSRD